MIALFLLMVVLVWLELTITVTVIVCIYCAICIEMGWNTRVLSSDWGICEKEFDL
jgi:hypothetical protein